MDGTGANYCISAAMRHKHGTCTKVGSADKRDRLETIKISVAQRHRHGAYSKLASLMRYDTDNALTRDYFIYIRKYLEVLHTSGADLLQMWGYAIGSKTRV